MTHSMAFQSSSQHEMDRRMKYQEPCDFGSRGYRITDFTSTALEYFATAALVEEGYCSDNEDAIYHLQDTFQRFS